MRRGLVRWAVALGFVAWAARSFGCDPSSTGSGAVDTDGDGLSDVEETTLHGTSPLLADTDGDGLSDYEEVVQRVFDPERAPLRFNPRVADLPVLQVEFVGPPVISFSVVDLNGETRTFGVTQLWQERFIATDTATATVSEGVTDNESATVSNTRAISRTTAAAQQFTPRDAGAATDAGATQPRAEVQPGPVTVTITLGDTDTSGVSFTTAQGQTNTVSLAFSESQAYEILRGYTLAESYAENHSLAASGGVIIVLATLRNAGNVPFEVTNIMLSAALELDDGLQVPLGNLDLLTRLTAFDPFSLGPGATVGPINFIREGLTLEQMANLLRNVRALVVRVGVTNLKNAAGKPYVFDVPAIQSRTATIDVDFGKRRDPERYLVATNLDPARPGVTARRVFDDILRIPFACDPDGGILSVREVGPETAEGGSWCFYHRRNGETDDMATAYCPYDCSDIDLHAGDLLRLVWSEP